MAKNNLLWSCDERAKPCRNSHGCHCQEIENLTARARVAEENLATARDGLKDIASRSNNHLSRTEAA